MDSEWDVIIISINLYKHAEPGGWEGSRNPDRWGETISINGQAKEIYREEAPLWQMMWERNYKNQQTMYDNKMEGKKKEKEEGQIGRNDNSIDIFIPR